MQNKKMKMFAVLLGGSLFALSGVAFSDGIQPNNPPNFADGIQPNNPPNFLADGIEPNSPPNVVLA